MLSQTSKVAIKAVIYLSNQSAEGRRAGVDEVAEKIDASKHTVGKALQKLAKDGLIHSVKGPSGGFFLEESQQSQPIYDIIKTIEGEGVFKGCGLGLEKCSESHPCPIHDDYKEVRTKIEAFFKKKQIKDLRAPVSDGSAFLSNYIA